MSPKKKLSTHYDFYVSGLLTFMVLIHTCLQTRPPVGQAQTVQASYLYASRNITKSSLRCRGFLFSLFLTPHCHAGLAAKQGELVSRSFMPLHGDPAFSQYCIFRLTLHCHFEQGAQLCTK